MTEPTRLRDRQPQDEDTAGAPIRPQPHRCARFAEITAEYDRVIAMEEDSAVHKSGTSRSKSSATNALIVKRRKASALNYHLRRCGLCSG